MPPRVRLSVANPLPTISETQEEILQDITNVNRCSGNFYINSDDCSSLDYLQSICQLARPTFPILTDNFNKAWCLGTFRNIKNDQRLPRLPETLQVNSNLKCKNSSNTILMKNVNLELFHAKSNSCFRADPLEQLYALTQKAAHSKDSMNEVNLKFNKQLENFSLCPKRRKNEPVLSVQETMVGKQNLSRVFSFPRLNSPRPMERENSCPELNRIKTSETMAHSETDSRAVRDRTTSINENIACPHPPEAKLIVKKGSQRRQHVWLKSEAIWEREDLKTLKHNDSSKGEFLNSKFSEYWMVDKRLLFHNWISECKSAWKEAKTKACLLPAIAEI
ncbi:uncharacterized protein LOC115476265 [Microcaecilia unicolor]|uniref:Uncharacterized protein LOC115476265 n=1 Tax=Microcaecilia unicolor TaxID=1415580 RepID=A0A6P7YYR2_9AMPH|nr:uncharacterized protein LOC115476265 [Microcaecilia unicolor]